VSDLHGGGGFVDFLATWAGAFEVGDSVVGWGDYFSGWEGCFVFGEAGGCAEVHLLRTGWRSMVEEGDSREPQWRSHCVNFVIMMTYGSS
jgi:hypothetical protein